MRCQPLQSLWKLSERLTPRQLAMQFFWVLLTYFELSLFSCFISGYPESKGGFPLWYGRGLFKFASHT